MCVACMLGGRCVCVCVCVVGMSTYTANTTPSAGSACVVNAHDQSFAAHPLSVQFAAGET